MTAQDPQIAAHLEWLGFVQPTGLVVSPTALVRDGAVLDRSDRLTQERLSEVAEETEDGPLIRDFERFAREVLGWSFSPKGYAGPLAGVAIPEELTLTLPDEDVTLLTPDVAVRELSPAAGSPPWQLLVTFVPPDQGLDEEPRHADARLTPHQQLERLLRTTSVAAGLLTNGRTLRLLSAPRGESSGWLDFAVADMLQPAGRPIAQAMRLLLRQSRLLTLPPGQRLAALLSDSRKFQNEVSERLSGQVLHALYELLRGFQAADGATGGELLGPTLADSPEDIYRALLTVVMRLVFLLYAEERGLLPAHPVFSRFYSLGALHERLREDAALHPDTISQRYGAWAQLLALFRIVHDGAAALGLPARHGELFDPDRFSFLEGRPVGRRQVGERIEPPLVPDSTVQAVLEQLLVLDGERLSYRALDVEQIGSVYETMMGFELHRASGPSIAIRASQRAGAPTAIDLTELLTVAAGERVKWIDSHAGRKLTGRTAEAVRQATSLEGLQAALAPVTDTAATPELAPAGALLLQPGEERRKSGSHYTPRSLTQPIVETTLVPLLARASTPDEILELKVCDPAMGSGAFLVEACRQLARALLDAWDAAGERPEIPADEDELIYAMRLVVQRCLYGVDRNPMAVDLAKMSLWLATLAREHPLTFLDHALRHGDSLVGLERHQIAAMHWKPGQPGLEGVVVQRHLDRVADLRGQIREATDATPDWTLRDMWDEARAELGQVTLIGDLAVACFFSAEKPKQREELRNLVALSVTNGQADQERWRIDERRDAHPPLAPFHWPVEFPEVFDRRNPGFDAIVGNPPFAGKNTLASANPAHYSDWLKQAHTDTHGNADLVAHFFRRAFDMLREQGTFGLIATNTIGQGDTRESGLGWICTHGGTIYAARKRVKWPSGGAAVVVSVVHVANGKTVATPLLDSRPVERISSYLFHGGSDQSPARLAANAGQSFQGSIVLGMGFTFDDTDTKGVANSLADMRRLLEENPVNAEIVFPYIGYSEVADSPTHSPHRYVINFGERVEDDCRLRWPELLAIVEKRVKPTRIAKTVSAIDKQRAARWWQFGSPAKQLYAAIADLDRVLVTGSQAMTRYALAFLPVGIVYSSNLTVFPFSSFAAFATLQSSVHEIWVRFFMSSLKDDLAYTPTTCFETFPFLAGWAADSELEVTGRAYHDYRSDRMVTNNEGLTKTYNRLHDPYESDPGIVRLRELHEAMDRAVLHAYGWDDIPTDNEFLLDYESDEEEWGNRKKPYRYRWPDEVRDEVLARLIQLNGERAAEEERAGPAAGATGRRRVAAAMAPPEGTLF